MILYAKWIPFTAGGSIQFTSAQSFSLSTNENRKSWNGELQYSTNGTNWSVWDGTTAIHAEKNSDNYYVLFMRGTENSVITGTSGENNRFVLSGTNIACSGNIENLLDFSTVSNGGHPQMATECFIYLFRDCTALTTAPELPATTLAELCYCDMFNGCTSLTSAPVLPADALAEFCYAGMFRGCTSLTNPPALPATTLALCCYKYMFLDCTSLAVAPVLPANILAESCYEYMFFNSGVALSTTQTEEYNRPWSIPAGATTATNWNDRMFSNTGGTFKGEPEVGVTYYQKGGSQCEHSFTNYTSDNNATCQANRTETATCDNGCGETDTREIPNSKVDHKYTNYIYQNDATYTSDGTEKAECDFDCGTTDTRTAVGTRLVGLGGTASINGIAKFGETLTVDTGGITVGTGTLQLQYQWQSGGINVGNNQSSYTLTEADIGKAITCEVTDSVIPGSVIATLSGTVTKADGPAAPTGLSVEAPVTAEGYGKIIGTNTSMEYSSDTAFSSPASCSDTVTSVSAGTYYVRYKETATRFAGAYATVNVPAYTPISYTITVGALQEVIQGEEAIFVSNADFVKFSEVQIDGGTVAPSAYSAVSGSTKITIKGAYTDTLSLGEHTFAIVSTDGKAETKFTVKAKESSDIAPAIVSPRRG